MIAELQAPAIIEAVVSKNANDVSAAHKLIEFLQGPAIDVPLKDFGMMKWQVKK